MCSQSNLPILMTKLLSLSLLAALSVGLSTTTFAAEKKKMEPAAATPAPDAKKSAEAATPKPKKDGPLPYQGKVDTLDAKAKKFTTKTKDGKVHTFTLTDKTVILKNDAPAKFDDVTVGETVRGTRLKKGEGEWEVVKLIIGAKPKTEAKPEKKKTE